MVAKERIIREIRRLLAEKPDEPLGHRRFENETGIKPSAWQLHWARWSEALREAGFAPNSRTTARSDEDLLSSVALLVKELGRFPTSSDFRVKGHSTPGFPSEKTLRRFGGQDSLRSCVRAFCVARGDLDVVVLLPVVADEASRRTSQESTEADAARSPNPDEIESGELKHGFVYLFKANGEERYRVGATDDVDRREKQHAREAPDGVKRIHIIETDDRAGVEAYWHRRFEDKRLQPDKSVHSWYRLERADVQAFMQWKRIY